MTEIKFFDQAVDSDLRFAVIAARYRGQWLLCRHGRRTTWELPGGHREEGEAIHAAARRELFEETGVTECQLEPVAAYGVYPEEGAPTYGALYFAEVDELGERPADSEIGENRLAGGLPEEMTYPEIQPVLMDYVQRWLAGGNFRPESEDLFEFLF